jgi:PQQ-dependent catabolism-associated CXXCW motif protein
MQPPESPNGRGVLRIFISYRRQDGPSYARELYRELSSHFPDSQIFWDIKMEPGVDFEDEIERAVGSCDVLVAVLGPRWLDLTDERGQRRLDDPADFVRLEIATALDRNIRVIPVLVQGASMPAPESLPEPLQRLARRNALELSDKRWEYDVGELIASLERVPHQKLVPPTGKGKFPADEPVHDTAATPVASQAAEPAHVNPPVRETTVLAANTRSDSKDGQTPAPVPRPKNLLAIAGVAALLCVLVVAFVASRMLTSPTPPVVDPTRTTVAAPAVPATSAPAATVQRTLAPLQPTIRPTQPAAVPTQPRLPTATTAAVLVNYADELTDFGVPPQSVLQVQQRIATPTPLMLPGGKVVTTMNLLAGMQSGNSFLLIDALAGPPHATIPSAIPIPTAGSPGSFQDTIQSDLDDQYFGLTNGNMDMAMVFFCQGARCWESYNASLRALDLGYTNVYWYRGGLAAWQDAGLRVTS